MHQRALDGCRNTIGLDGMRACVPALAIMWGYASFCATSGQTDDAREWYMQALTGHRDMLGEAHSTCQALLDDIKALNSKSQDSRRGSSMDGRASTHTVDETLPLLKNTSTWRSRVMQKLVLMRRRSGSSRHV